mmetsp:Transcript_9639/g.22933  ORF Transcript_9639/g.22933 Transcript_9639/m.22933 type:complete len:238 (-) Transcript_9639:1890-2603(-)
MHGAIVRLVLTVLHRARLALCRGLDSSLSCCHRRHGCGAGIRVGGKRHLGLVWRRHRPGRCRCYGGWRADDLFRHRQIVPKPGAGVVQPSSPRLLEAKLLRNGRHGGPAGDDRTRHFPTRLLGQVQEDHVRVGVRQLDAQVGGDGTARDTVQVAREHEADQQASSRDAHAQADSDALCVDVVLSFVFKRGRWGSKRQSRRRDGCRWRRRWLEAAIVPIALHLADDRLLHRLDWHPEI